MRPKIAPLATLILLATILTVINAKTAPETTTVADQPAPQLQVSSNGRYLESANKEPFFWLADTAWELLHRLDYNQSEHYLTTRRQQGFNVIQTVILAEKDGLRVPNRNGDLPLIDLDPNQPNEAYFDYVDRVVNRANELGLVVALLPTWGDKFNIKWGVGPEVFDVENAHSFGKYLGERYADASIVWVLGGDRIPEEPEDFAIIEAMATGLREGDGERHLISYHPQGRQSSANFFHEETWLDFNMHQSSHGKRDYNNFRDTLEGAGKKPTKPILDSEPCYEDIPIGFKTENGWFSAFESRRAGYWSVLAGAFGHTYGHHSVWQMWEPGLQRSINARTPWQEAIYYPGAYQAGYMKSLFGTLPWTELKPAAASRLAEGPTKGPDAILVAETPNSRTLVAYAPFGSPFTLDLAVAPTEGYWFNPRNATRIPLLVLPDTGGPRAFDPPADEGRGNDWVLVLEAR